MADAQKFLYKALAVTFVIQKSNIYTSEESFWRALSSETFFYCAFNGAEVMLIF